jgi:hypothetical protein
VREAELAAAADQLDRRKALQGEIQRQIDELKQRETTVREGLAKLQERLNAQVSEAAKILQAEVTAMAEAASLETSALNDLGGRGAAAIGAARRAAQGRISEAQQKNAEYAGNPDPRLTAISSDRFMGGHVAAIAGDMHVAAALIQLGQSEGLAAHAATLILAEQMGIDGSKLLAPETPADSVPAELLTSQAAATAATESRTKAVQAADEAVAAFSDENTKGELENFWGLSANLAAVHFLKSTIVTDPTQQKDERQKAYDEYERATRERPDRPETRLLQPIMRELTRK